MTTLQITFLIANLNCLPLSEIKLSSVIHLCDYALLQQYVGLHSARSYSKTKTLFGVILL